MTHPEPLTPTTRMMRLVARLPRMLTEADDYAWVPMGDVLVAISNIDDAEVAWPEFDEQGNRNVALKMTTLRDAAYRAARQTPDSGLRDAAQAVCDQAELDDSGFDGECLDYLVPIPTIRTLRAALADTAERPLDVERLADAMLNEADRQAIEGPSYPKGWRGKAERLAAEYARLTEDQP